MRGPSSAPITPLRGSFFHAAAHGGVNIGECGNTFEPEKVTSYELGYKGRLLDNRLSVGVSVFHYDYTNLQLFQFLPLTTLIQNAPKAEVDGLELEGVLRADEHWTLNANATFLDARYGSFLSFDDINRGAGQQDLKGNRLNYSPKAAANFGVEYRSDDFSFGRLTARVDVSLTGKQYFRPFNEPQDAQGSYSVVNLNVIWDSPDERLRARLFVRNLTDEEYLTTLGSSGTFGSRFGNFAAPRQAGFEVRANF
jgi:iron complex outermembrane receptor protein